MLALLNSKLVRNFAVAGCLGALAWAASPAHAAKERVTSPMYNGDVAGTNANRFYAELIGADLFYSWSGTNQAGAVLFNNGNNAGVNDFTAAFGGGMTVGSGAGMMFDTIRDKGGRVTRKPGPGAIKPTTFQIAGAPVRDVVTRIDPLNKTVRKAANLTESTGAGEPLEVELTNESDDEIFVSGLTVQVNNIDDPMDFSTPFIPDGAIVSLDLPFAATSLSPGDSLIYAYSGAYDEAMAVSVVATSVWGGDTFTGTLGTYVSDGAVPEPAAMSMLGILAITMLRRRAAEEKSEILSSVRRDFA